MTRRTPTTLDYALLGLLYQLPRSGYDLRKVFETTADTTTALRPKQVFRPTKAGRETLSDWLVREIEREDVERRIDELMLRFAFHWVLDSRTATRRFLESFLGEVEDYLGELNRQHKVFPAGAPLQSRLALAAGIEQYRACTRWARKAIKEFTEEGS
jgi:DNA-binding PadR family transcriptional regulator